MKYLLQSESPCVECKTPKKNKEFKLEAEPNDVKITSYERYIINDCNKCGKYKAKLV